MNRRGFLRLLGAGAAGLVLDPELLLWRPGAKTFFLPPIGANQFITADWLSMHALRLLTNDLEVTRYFHQSLDREYQERFEVGESVQVKYPEVDFSLAHIIDVKGRA